MNAATNRRKTPCVRLCSTIPDFLKQFFGFKSKTPGNVIAVFQSAAL